MLPAIVSIFLYNNPTYQTGLQLYSLFFVVRYLFSFRINNLKVFHRLEFSTTITSMPDGVHYIDDIIQLFANRKNQLPLIQTFK